MLDVVSVDVSVGESKGEISALRRKRPSNPKT
jgi:hypothetical protein